MWGSPYLSAPAGSSRAGARNHRKHLPLSGKAQSPVRERAQWDIKSYQLLWNDCKCVWWSSVKMDGRRQQEKHLDTDFIIVAGNLWKTTHHFPLRLMTSPREAWLHLWCCRACSGKRHYVEAKRQRESEWILSQFRPLKESPYLENSIILTFQCHCQWFLLKSGQEKTFVSTDYVFFYRYESYWHAVILYGVSQCTVHSPHTHIQTLIPVWSWTFMHLNLRRKMTAATPTARTGKRIHSSFLSEEKMGGDHHQHQNSLPCEC